MSLIQLLKFKEMETELYETSHFIMLHFQTEVFETNVWPNGYEIVFVYVDKILNQI